MCGIYGVIDHNQPISPEFLEKRRDTLSHRGPDDAGLWLNPSRHVGLGHRRLAILDLSAAGHQPMVSPDGRYAIVFNGEIYNFRELRAELEKLGCPFHGHSDTEVVLAAYMMWGEACLGRFNGMFAFAIYDDGGGECSPSVFFARDRAGKKPFYYRRETRRFQFASELKALDGPRELDPDALNFYLALGYVPDDRCLVSGVNKLPPAHAARLNLATLDLNVWRYWTLPTNKRDAASDGEMLADQVQSILLDSVRLRLISDVPVGVLLSGGLDSSLIVAAAAQQSAGPVKTFTIAIPGSQYNEAHYARQVADYFSTEHHVLDVGEPSLDVLQELAAFVDEPIADSSLLPSFMVTKLTRRHVTVALGGDGGDELFGGYSDYPVSLSDQRRWGWIPAMALSMAGTMASALPAGVKGRNRLTSLRGGPLQQMIWGSPYFDAALRRRIFNRAQFQEMGEELDAPEHWLLGLYQAGGSPIDSMTRTHFGSILPDDFLVKVDRASMANSLEMRSPFLDYRLVEFAFSSIPDRWKVCGSETRRVQKILAKRMLPPSLDVQRKQGFSIPMDEWLRADGCRVVWDVMSDLPEAINKMEVENLIRGHMNGRANGARLFALLMLGVAMRNWKRL